MSNLHQFKTLCCETAQFFNLTDYVYQESISFGFMQTLAEQGDADAQRWLADCYYYGVGVAQDWQQALHWYTVAASQGDVVAVHFIKVCEECSNLKSSPSNIKDWFIYEETMSHYY